MIVWLSSYPKSGNTWLRIFLTNFQHDDHRPANIDLLDISTVASSRNLFDSALGIESSDMTDDEIEHSRAWAWRCLASRHAKTLYVKTHDAYTVASDGEPLVPADVSQGVIYIARNPLDVVISFAHHSANSIDFYVDRLALEEMALCGSPGRIATQLRQPLLSWSRHVLSWLDQNTIPVHVIRYEDMSVCPVETFASVVRFLGFQDDIDRVTRAVEFSSFEVLRQQEQARGFRERPARSASFFRQGRPGAWRDVLTKDQVARIIADHGSVMRRLGYLSENSRIEALQ